MHRCLSIPEILALICDFVILGRSHRKHRRDLGSLARSCRTWYPPAVAALWETLDSLRPLLRSLPPDTFVRNEKKKLETEFIVNRHIRQESLTRFIFLASLVKELRLTWVPDKTCFDALHLSLPTPFLPNLRAFEWLQVKSDSLNYSLLFLHDKITRLVIRPSLSASENVLTMLPRLHILCPHIQFFELLGNYVFRLQRLRIISEAATRWENIQSLAIPHLDEKDLMRLATFPKLNELSITSPSNDLSNVFSMPTPSFPMLRGLVLQPHLIKYAINFLRAVPTTLRLHTLHIICRGTETREDWASCIVAAMQTCEWRTLRNVAIKETADYDEDDIEEGDDVEWPYSVSFAMLVQLKRFPNLRHIDLECWGGFLICDSQMLDLATAWRHLETLNLVARRDGERPYKSTIHALLNLAQHCPFLQRLTLDFDARDLTYAERDTRGVRQLSLTYLDVRRSFIASARVVAAFLSAIFPKLASITSEADEADSDDSSSSEGSDNESVRQKKWRQVQQLLPVLTFVRTQERHEQAGDGQADSREASPLEDWSYNTDCSDL
ncbi:hypothetical protein BD626DRAFT_477258 [Schizophyllum amplum]|uniref:F-box domain-containing protein n=1 Tax=Schizophyllum amplum TaxID=97359 RepID=A0A550D010_9AGAR|nr:hypothetical protein BD626DRAFT_477258 [Auriculariopsis ampla]